MRKSLILTAALALAAALLLVQPLHAATPITVVTIGFDDGYADQYLEARTLLSSRGLHATFYVNTGLLGEPGRMDWTQVKDLYGDGNEIAGHTLHHVNVKKLKVDPAKIEICGDHQNLVDNGVGDPGTGLPVSFAYPFGSHDPLSESVVASCGYTNARGVSGVNDRKVFAETIPPLEPYATRTPPNPKQGTTLDTIKGYVIAAETHGGGWVQYVFHHVCDQCDAYSITPDNLSLLLDWLKGEIAAGRVVVMTTAEAMASAP
jgi:peptidoglycan/xylan/chitin deacetylase (PgdA/CDA1 family)